MKENYQKILDETIAGLEERGEVPKLLLHSCCAPCSSYVLEYLSNYFYITVLYYNPNIYPEDEYYHRAAEQKRFIKEFPTKYAVSFVEGNFEPELFYETVKGYENIREGGERCFRCYELRLREAAEYVKRVFQLPFVTVYGDDGGSRLVKKAAVCPGAGGPGQLCQADAGGHCLGGPLKTE